MTRRRTYETEEKLRTYQFVIESAHDAIFFKDLESRYIIVNNKTIEAFGLPKEDVIGKNDYELMPYKKDAEKNVNDDQIVFKSAKPIKVTDHMTGADGKEHWFQIKKVPQFDENGNVIGLVGVARDITKQKRIEEALKESEEKYRNLIERANDGVIIVQDGVVKFYNTRLLDMVGYNTDEMYDTPFLDYVFPDDRIRIKDLHERRLKGEDVPDIYEMRVLNKIGKTLDVEINSGIITYHGKPAVLGFIRDITGRKQAEEALRMSEERFRDLTERTSDWIWEVNRKGVYTYSSPKIIDLLGYEPEEIIGKTPFDLMPSKEAKEVFDIFYDIVSSRRSFYSLENINLHKNGHHVILETSGIPIFDFDGEFCGYRGIDRDITERKRSEEALESERDKLKALLDGLAETGIGVDIVSDEYEILQQNQTLVDRFGNIDSKKCYQKYLALEEPCSFCPMVKALENKRLERVEMQGSGGRDYEILSAPLTNPDGTINKAIEVIIDISERKQAQKELRKAHDELEHRVKERTKELEIKTKNLEELNTALEVLLKKREGDKKVLEKNVLANVKGMIEPYFKKIKKTKMDDEQKVLLSIIESNLHEIISPFANKLSSKYINLTPAEIQVADFVKHGKRNKEIASFLNLSIRTIESHRESIRKKIGIKNKKTNLRSYLLSLR